MINKSIKKLVTYAIEKELIKPEDKIYITNSILAELKLSEYNEPSEEYTSVDLEETLCELLDYAVEAGIIEDSIVYRDLFDTKLMGIKPDVLFFSSHSIDNDGIITDPTEEENYLRSLMLDNAKQSVFLCDSEKFNRKSVYTLTSIDDIDVAVFDSEWNALETKCKII